MVGDLITVEEVAKFESVSLSSIQKQLAGKRSTTLVAVDRPGPSGRLRKLIYSGTMSLDAQKRYSAEKTAAMIEPRDLGLGTRDSGKPAKDSKLGIGDNGSTPAQLHLLDRTEEDAAIESVRQRLAQVAPSQITPVLARYRAIRPTLNHDIQAGHGPTRTEYYSGAARQLGIGVRHFLRLRSSYIDALSKDGPQAAIESLTVSDPGPKKWTGSPLDPNTEEGRSNISFIVECWEFRKLTRRQCYRELVNYLEAKQRGTHASFIYQIPSEGAVFRFINMDPPYGLGGEKNLRRLGAGALKERAGYIDCHYDDEFAGDTWCIDEWELDGAFYNPQRRREIFWSIYLVSVIDERTTRILDWTLAYHLNTETVLDLLERTVREFGPPLFLRSDRGGHFRGKVAGRKAVQGRGKLMEELTGAMGRFGVTPVGPETDHNPRSNRIERMHGIYGGRAQGDFGPSWRGSQKKEIKPGVTERQMSGIDDRVNRHIKEHCKLGTSGPLILSTADAERIVGKWVDEINLADTDAKGCAGMSRLAAFQEFQPPAEELARRRSIATPELIDLAFAERDERAVRAGGVVEWRGGLRYSHPDLVDYVGEALPMLRYRRDTSKITVEVEGRLITAQRRIAVGRNDGERLAEEMERLNRTRKLMARTAEGAPSLENGYEQESRSGISGARELGNSAQAIQDSKFKIQDSGTAGDLSSSRDPESRDKDSAAGAYGLMDKALNTALAAAPNSSNGPDVNPAIANPPQEESCQPSVVSGQSEHAGGEWLVAGDEQDLEDHSEISSMEWMSRRRNAGSRAPGLPSPESRTPSPELPKKAVGYADLE